MNNSESLWNRAWRIGWICFGLLLMMFAVGYTFIALALWRLIP